jgi:hypothetical protein
MNSWKPTIDSTRTLKELFPRYRFIRIGMSLPIEGDVHVLEHFCPVPSHFSPILQVHNMQQNRTLRIAHGPGQASVGQMTGMCDQG